MTNPLLISPCGECGLRVESTSGEDDEDWRTVHNLSRLLGMTQLPGLYNAVPTYNSTLLEFDPVLTDADTVTAFVRLLEQAHDLTAPLPQARIFDVPVVYGSEYGPDLPFVADYLELSQSEVIRLHGAQDLIVRCLGGPAASCMTDGPELAKPIPRLDDPRLSVPAQTVSLAGRQGVIGPVKAPSGWRAIGITPIQLMDLDDPDLVPYRPGDHIRFRAIEESQWDQYNGRAMRDMEVQR
ncbi:MAG: allophanate hydrolase subunit 1 [Bifidobacterium tibiigranuli]|jgi:KipI family sensor histidine kinase inhibitor|nr:allophanate hydrolase subunit 1 [Bifidobacterium tibiigranuli]